MAEMSESSIGTAVPRLRFVLLSAVAAAAYALVVGVVTAIIPTPWIDRILPVNAWNLASLLVPALLFGPLAATYLVPWPTACNVGGRTGWGAGLSWFATSCPACNKLVVLAVGMSGATGFVRALQPVIGLISVMLLGFALRTRFRSRVPQRAALDDGRPA